MPYSSNADLPAAVRSRYSDHCQAVWRNVWNSVHSRTGDESRAFASANSQAQKCEGSKAMAGEMLTGNAFPMFKIFAPLLKADRGLDNKMRLHGVASSTIKDRAGHQINASALADMERTANQNLTIFLNHEYQVPEDVAGYVEMAAIRQHPLDPEIQDLSLDIVINETNDRAVKAWEAIQAGTKLGLSIGAMVPDGGARRDRKTGLFSVDHVELLETSLVGVPANPRSWVEYAVKSLSAMPLATSDDGVVMIYNSIDDEEHTVEDELELDAMSSEHRNSLPDSAFACPEKRKYPHHTASGALDKAHLRNALSRCGDESNDQCGCAHIRAHAKAAGIGDSNKSMDELLVLALNADFDEAHFAMEAEDLEHHDDPPEVVPETPVAPEEPAPVAPDAEPDAPATITDATVSVETPFANITVDTGNRGTPKVPDDGSSQEALASAPETEDEDKEGKDNPWSGILPVRSGDDLLDEDITSALQVLEPTLVASIHTSNEVLRAVTSELISTRVALDVRNEEYAALEEMTIKVLESTREILDKVSSTPLGRKSVIREANDSFGGLEEVYGSAFVNLLKRS